MKVKCPIARGAATLMEILTGVSMKKDRREVPHHRLPNGEFVIEPARPVGVPRTVPVSILN